MRAVEGRTERAEARLWKPKSLKHLLRKAFFMLRAAGISSLIAIALSATLALAGCTNGAGPSVPTAITAMPAKAVARYHAGRLV